MFGYILVGVLAVPAAIIIGWGFLLIALHVIAWMSRVIVFVFSRLERKLSAYT